MRTAFDETMVPVLWYNLEGHEWDQTPTDGQNSYMGWREVFGDNRTGHDFVFPTLTTVSFHFLGSAAFPRRMVY